MGGASWLYACDPPLPAYAAGLVRTRSEGSKEEKRCGFLTGCECVGAYISCVRGGEGQLLWTGYGSYIMCVSDKYLFLHVQYTHTHTHTHS